MHTMPDVEGLDSEAMYQILTPVQEESAANEIHWARDCNSTVVRETITEITYETLEQEQLAGEYGFIGAYTTSSFYEDTSELITMDNNLPTTINPNLLTTPSPPYQYPVQPSTANRQYQYANHIRHSSSPPQPSYAPIKHSNIHNLAVAHLDPTALNGHRGPTAFAHQHQMQQFMQSARSRQQSSQNAMSYAPAQQHHQSVQPQQQPNPFLDTMSDMGQNSTNAFQPQQQPVPMMNYVSTPPLGNAGNVHPVPAFIRSTKEFNWLTSNRGGIHGDRLLVYDEFQFTKDEVLLVIALDRFLGLDADTCAELLKFHRADYSTLLDLHGFIVHLPYFIDSATLAAMYVNMSQFSNDWRVFARMVYKEWLAGMREVCIRKRKEGTMAEGGWVAGAEDGAGDGAEKADGERGRDEHGFANVNVNVDGNDDYNYEMVLGDEERVGDESPTGKSGTGRKRKKSVWAEAGWRGNPFGGTA